MAQTYYPKFDVTAEAEAWDDHTRSIVMQRLEPPPKPKFLKSHEIKMLHVLIKHLLYESREDIIAYILSHIDTRLHERQGEGQRKTDAPPEADLVRRGLVAIDAVAKHRHSRLFTHCSTEEQFNIVSVLQQGSLETIPEMQTIPQKELFKKWLSLSVEAYASHPTVWSEMGYAGPAYPRGYYRIERGLRDPWEPVAERRGRESGQSERVEGADDV